MTSYFENFKWIISKQEEQILTSKSPDKFVIIEKPNHNNEIGPDYDFGPTNNDNLISQKNLEQNYKDVILQYDTIHLEMIEKEQLVRERLDSDTIDKIKSNYTDYINDDIKIIKDFAIIMETFSHIQNKLSEFECGIKEFETDIRTKTLNIDTNNLEFENKIQQIDIKLNNTIKFMEEIKSNNNIVMEQIIKLENTINSNDIKGHELLTKLEKINVVKNNKNGYLHIPSHDNFNNILIYVLTGSCVLATFFGIKYILRKN